MKKSEHEIWADGFAKGFAAAGLGILGAFVLLALLRSFVAWLN